MKTANKLAVAIGQTNGQDVTSVGKALGAKLAATSVVLAASLAVGAANAAITVPTELIDVFSELGQAFGTLMGAGAILFGIIRGGVALFKIAGRVFSAAGA